MDGILTPDDRRRESPATLKRMQVVCPNGNLVASEMSAGVTRYGFLERLDYVGASKGLAR